MKYYITFNFKFSLQQFKIINITLDVLLTAGNPILAFLIYQKINEYVYIESFNFL